MKVMMIKDRAGRLVTILECPNGFNIKAVWTRWSPQWEARNELECVVVPRSFADCDRRMSFIEHLLWSHGCKHLAFEEFTA